MPRAPRIPLEEQFWSKVDKRGPDECWPWSRSLVRGYGNFSYHNPETLRTSARVAHRFAYEAIVGPIPEGLTLDHTCHDPKTCAGGLSCPHRRCCNPAHLEPVTHRENILRGDTLAARNAAKTHCPKGHPFDEANTRYYPNGARLCKTCANEVSRICRLKRKASHAS